MSLDLEPRELQEIEFALLYHEQFNHGTSGHLPYTVIAKLYKYIRENDVRPDPIRIDGEMLEDIGLRGKAKVFLDGRDVTDVCRWAEPEIGRLSLAEGPRRSMVHHGEVTTDPPFEELKELLGC